MAKSQCFLGGVMDAYVYQGDQLLFVSKALTDSSINIGVTAEEIRAGKGNKLLGKLYHDSTFGLELQDAIFDLNYIGLNCGAQVVAGNGELKEEQIECTEEGKLEASFMPKDFMSLGRLGWISNTDQSEWIKFEFDTDASTAQGVEFEGQPIVVGEKYCIKYVADTDCEEITIPADFVPAEVSVILRGDLYKASKGGDVSSSSVAGHVEVEVPRLQLQGEMELTLNATGAANIPFSGSALVTSDGTAGCESGGYYAKIRRIEAGGHWYDGLIGMAIEGGDAIKVKAGKTKTVVVYGIYKSGSKRLDASKLTWVKTGDFTLDEQTGKIGAGTGTLKISAPNGVSVDATVETI